MATRTRTQWRARSDGQYDGRVGWKINQRGKRQQHRFRLGSDLKEAKRRDGLLRQMWERIEQSAYDPLWTTDTLHIAQQVAKGVAHPQAPRKADEEIVPYGKRVHALRRLFPMLAIVPEPDYSSALGVALLEYLDVDPLELEEKAAKREKELRRSFQERLSSGLPPKDQPAGPKLHQAMRDYIGWLELEYSHPETTVTSWGRVQIRQVESLIQHHANTPLAHVDRDKIEEMLRYWRQRPHRRGSKQRVSRKSATHYISALRNFFKWLHVQPNYEWRKPDDLELLKTRVVTLDNERRTQVQSEQVFSLEELSLLYRYGAPLDRLLILLGLNCGFGAAESASLLVGEIFLRTPHSERQREMLGCEFRPDDSFIKRVRRKSSVYGEFLLFGQTVRGIEWALRERRKHPGFDSQARLLLNGKGQPFDKPSRSGNANRQIPNRYARLKQQVIADHPTFSALPFKTLRKTGGDLVKRFSDGEVAGVFLCHGKPVATDELADEYTQRPFGKVFTALRQVEQHLASMFQAGGEQPFGPEAEA